MGMIDYVKLKLRAGKGGDGAVSFERYPKKPKGPPDGGDGGDGGNLYLETSKDLTTLLPYRYKKHFEAGDGERGGKTNKKGKHGEDLILEVPVGTKVSDGSGEEIIDLVKIGQKVMIAKGGKGGRGNAHVKRSEFDQNTSPFKDIWHWFEKGEETHEVEVTLELKLLADAGLIGLPNAGKSTLLSKLTGAHPKIAGYAFTTLEPNLGVMKHKGKELVIADIPGLIEGASSGKGLGDQFLRHVERTKMLVHLISADLNDPIAAVNTINHELAQYSRILADKEQIYVLSKIDTVNLDDFNNKIDQLKSNNIKVLPISSMSGDGLDKLQDEIIRLSS